VGRLGTGLPDGIFSNQPKIPIWVKFGQWEIVGMFYGHLVHFTAIAEYFVVIWYSLRTFGIFFPFWYQEKSGNPGGGVNLDFSFRLFNFHLLNHYYLLFFLSLLKNYNHPGGTRSQEPKAYIFAGRDDNLPTPCNRVTGVNAIITNMVNLHYVVNSHMCDRYKYCHV
jgi:hypothetical protein